MKRKFVVLLLALAACAFTTLPARADGPLCGTSSNPSFICPAAAPAPTPSPLEAAGDAVLDALLSIL